ISRDFPVLRFFTTAPVTPLPCPPRIFSTTVSQSQAILGFLNARSCMIFEARRAPRRWTTVTLEANLVRKVASSMAVSPPPTTTARGSRLAREAYRAAVKPAGPEPRMTTRYCVFFMDEIPPAEHGRQDSITGARGSLDSPRGGRYGLAMPTAARIDVLLSIL